MSCTGLEKVRSQLEAGGHSHVRIIAVSKTHGPEQIRELIECGQRDFGENRQNEARDKFPLVHTADLPPEAQPIYHHIGPLQSGSARQVCGLFDWVHGVGSLSALNALAKANEAQSAKGSGTPIRYLIQVQLTNEASKLGGTTPEELEALISARPRAPSLEWRGFMAMGPEAGSPTQIRTVFRSLRQLRDRYCPNGELSMGMSGDWQIAVEEGATMIRLGTALFGSRADGPWKPGQ